MTEEMSLAQGVVSRAVRHAAQETYSGYADLKEVQPLIQKRSGAWEAGTEIQCGTQIQKWSVSETMVAELRDRRERLPS
jgi:hypothetical protein